MAASGSSHETLIEFNMRLVFRSRNPEFSGRGRNKRVDSRFPSALMSTVQISAPLKRGTLNVELGTGMAMGVELRWKDRAAQAEDLTIAVVGFAQASPQDASPADVVVRTKGQPGDKVTGGLPAGEIPADFTE
jgi:hypothetical protein